MKLVDYIHYAEEHDIYQSIGILLQLTLDTVLSAEFYNAWIFFDTFLV